MSRTLLRHRLFLIPCIALMALSCAHAPPAPAPPAHPLASPRNDIAGLPNFAQVSDELYRGAQPTREGFEALKRMGVKTIVDLRGEAHHDDLEKLGFKYVQIPTNANKMKDEDIAKFLRVVKDPANQPVFVHCRRGADRTGCAVAAYRIVEQGWNVNDAEAELPRFHFSPIWQDIPKYLETLNPDAMRNKVRAPRPMTSTAPSSTEHQ